MNNNLILINRVVNALLDIEAVYMLSPEEVLELKDASHLQLRIFRTDKVGLPVFNIDLVEYSADGGVWTTLFNIGTLAGGNVGDYSAKISNVPNTARQIRIQATSTLLNAANSISIFAGIQVYKGGAA